MKNILMNEISKIPDEEVALLLSGGIDSNSLMFALLEAGKKVKAYTFVLEDKMSRDYIHAEKNAYKFGVEFNFIDLPTNQETLMADIHNLVYMGARTKTDFECGWPMIYAYQQIKEKTIVSGMGADGHFCLTKKGMIHYRDKMDEFRSIQFSKPNYCQKQIHNWLCNAYQKNFVTPYTVQEMQEYFKGKTWDELNRPHQKQTILDAFPEQFKAIKVFKHQNLQLGDSGISDLFYELVGSEYNTMNHSTVVGIFNRVIKELV
jgi:asparagine synthetase B (glutamine-hydrolysing)